MNNSSPHLIFRSEDNKWSTSYFCLAILSLISYRYVRVVFHDQKHKFWLGDVDVIISLTTIWKYWSTDCIGWQTIWATAASLAILGIFAFLRSGNSEASRSYHDHDFPIPPLFLPSQTTHTRIFPTKHSFSYSYLLVGIPIASNAGTRWSMSPSSWFSVNSEDYLQRGHHGSNLHDKLRSYLKTQDIDPQEYSFAYLVTAPRFLGFSFNPVSFWYLYDRSAALSAMILEVNNTFDERRMYFLNKSSTGDLFKQEWAKDFHVSPFNDRQGTYSLIAKDPILTKQIDNTITLRSLDGKAKVVAKIYSTGTGIATSEMTTTQRLRFLLQWSWVGFLTNLRILHEARKLWIKKLPVFYRPEPVKSNIGRTPTEEETMIERTIQPIFGSLGSKANICIEYIPGAGPNTGQKVLIGANPEGASQFVTLQIGTPAFYSELVCAPHFGDFLMKHSLQLDDTQKMFWVNDTEAFEKLLSGIHACTEKRQANGSYWSPSKVRGTLNLILGLSGVRLGPPSLSAYDEIGKIFLSRREFNELLKTSSVVRHASKVAFGQIWLWQLYVIAFRWTTVSVIASVLMNKVQ